MNPCPQFETLLVDLATGELEGEALHLLEQHLGVCAACATEANSLRELLELASLPAQSVEERAAVAALPGLTAAAWRRSERHRALVLGAAAGFLAAVAAAGLILLPGSRRHPPTRPAEGPDPSVAAIQRWASPWPFNGVFTEPVPEEVWDVEEDGG
jgi:anti-sigma factor RsiW